jgi:hypothetical protein
MFFVSAQERPILSIYFAAVSECELKTRYTLKADGAVLKATLDF